MRATGVEGPSELGIHPIVRQRQPDTGSRRLRRIMRQPGRSRKNRSRSPRRPRNYETSARPSARRPFKSEDSPKVSGRREVMNTQPRASTCAFPASETRAFPRFARFSRLRTRCGTLQKSRVSHERNRSWRRPRRFFSWLLASATIVICSSKIAQLESSRPGASSPSRWRAARSGSRRGACRRVRGRCRRRRRRAS